VTGNRSHSVGPREVEWSRNGRKAVASKGCQGVASTSFFLRTPPPDLSSRDGLETIEIETLSIMARKEGGIQIDFKAQELFQSNNWRWISLFISAKTSQCQSSTSSEIEARGIFQFLGQLVRKDNFSISGVRISSILRGAFKYLQSIISPSEM